MTLPGDDSLGATELTEPQWRVRLISHESTSTGALMTPSPRRFGDLARASRRPIGAECEHSDWLSAPGLRPQRGPTTPYRPAWSHLPVGPQIDVVRRKRPGGAATPKCSLATVHFREQAATLRLEQLG
jgi:hypothetical protein